MPSSTIYNPENIASFEKSKLMKDAKGVTGTINHGQTENLDYALADDCLLIMGRLLVNGANKGDSVSLQVLAPNNAIVAQFVTDWAIDWTVTLQQGPVSNYPAKIPAGFKIRLVYKSTGDFDVWVALNIDKEKVLI